MRAAFGDDRAVVEAEAQARIARDDPDAGQRHPARRVGEQPERLAVTVDAFPRDPAGREALEDALPSPLLARVDVPFGVFLALASVATYSGMMSALGRALAASGPAFPSSRP